MSFLLTSAHNILAKCIWAKVNERKKTAGIWVLCISIIIQIFLIFSVLVAIRPDKRIYAYVCIRPYHISMFSESKFHPNSYPPIYEQPSTPSSANGMFYIKGYTIFQLIKYSYQSYEKWMETKYQETKEMWGKHIKTRVNFRVSSEGDVFCYETTLK